jgi:hypothetical protein
MTTRYAADEISGFSISTLDIRYMVEMAQFLSLGACGIAQLQKYAGRLRELRIFKVLALVEPSDLAQCFAFIAIGFHFGNYFWSGVTKLELGPDVWSWAFLNHTQNLMLGALKRGILLSGPVPWLTQTLFDNFGKMVVLSNIAVLVAQLLAVVAVLRVRWLVIASLVYDVLHIGIYIFGGLFFWPWVWNNLSVIFAVRDKSDKDIGWPPKLCCIITILFGGSLTLGGSARLAWWDVADIKIPIIQAQAANGNWVDVPTSFFLTHSTTISHGYEDLAKTQDHYLPTLWNATLDFDRQKTSGTCPEPPHIVFVETQSARQERLERLGKFLRAHHRKILGRADKNGHYNFYLRLYIHPANPLLNEKFGAIDLREIKRYRLLTQSTCMSMKNGRLVERVIKEDVVTFNVDD